MSLLATRGQLPAFRSVFDVAQHYEKLKAADAALPRIYSLTSSRARCLVGPDLATKYGLEQDNQQLVVSITNRHTLDQTWFNEARTKKPQTFSQDPSAFLDSTGGGERCDFCRWPQLTAADAGFGRVQLQHAVTGSNLFKYAEPGHGIVLFRHHDPLTFDFDQLSDLVNASWLWFWESAAEHHQYHQQQQQQQRVDMASGSTPGAEGPEQLHPFLLWNCLPRAGASQYHGHAQVVLSAVPVPHQQRLWQAAAAYPRTSTTHTTSPYSSSSSSSSSSSDGVSPAATVQAPNALCPGAWSNAGQGQQQVQSKAQQQGQQQGGQEGQSEQQQRQQQEGQQQQQQEGQQEGQAEAGSAGTYYTDLLLAHAEVGLLRQLTLTGPSTSCSNPPQQRVVEEEQQEVNVGVAASSNNSSSSSSVFGVGLATRDSSSSSMATSGSSSSMAMSTDSVPPAGAGAPQQQQQQQQQQQCNQQQGQHSKQQQAGVECHTAWVLASLCPLKDMEVVVLGAHLTCPAFQTLLHTGLRTLIDDLGCRTFNVGVLNVDLAAAPHPAVQQRLEQQVVAHSAPPQHTSSAAAGAASAGHGSSGMEGTASAAEGNGTCSSSGGGGGGVGGGSSRRHIGSYWRAEVLQPPPSPHTDLIAASEGLRPDMDEANNGGAGGSSKRLQGPPSWVQQVPAAPVLARVVSRGRLTSAASDFGGLEVFGGASIGHTDPFRVMEALDTRLQLLLAAEEV